MSRNGLLVDYEYCTGCHSCEVACKQEHDFSGGRCGIKVDQIVTELPGRIRIDYLPFPTEFCDLCAARTSNGEQPACVHNCPATCMMYGTITELAKAMENKPRSVVFPR